MKKTILFLAMFAIFTFVMATCVSAQTVNALPTTNAQALTTDELFDISNIPADATADQLEERIMAMMNHRPPALMSDEQLAAFMAKRVTMLRSIVEQILKCEDATEEQKENARGLKLTTFIMGSTQLVDVDKVIAEIEVYQKELAETKSEVQYEVPVMAFLLKLRKIVIPARMGMEGDHLANFKNLFEEAKTFLNENEFQPAYAQLPMMFLQVAEMFDRDGKEGLQKFIITELKPILAKSDVEEAKEVLEHIEGLLRFAELPGSEIEFQCVLLDGKKLDIKDFRDKVVLIDFWATWCVPCQMAMPVMKRLYDKYHDKDFEIIAYSCDEDLDDLKTFAELSPHSWPVASAVMSVEAELTDYSTYYGIPGYPTFVLIGKDGKVLHVTHDISEITRMLGELFP